MSNPDASGSPVNGPEDIEQRVEAVGEQIVALRELNHRFQKGFTFLQQAIVFGRKIHELSDEDFVRYKDINERANKAKHEGLGVEGAAEIHRFQTDPSERLKGVINLKTPGGSAQQTVASLPEGNFIGELETCFSKYIGRPLRKNEPRYRWGHRPGNKGAFTAIVCLDALPTPVELIGDTYARKKDAQQSAALQGIHHIQALILREGGVNGARGKKPPSPSVPNSAAKPVQKLPTPSNSKRSNVIHVDDVTHDVCVQMAKLSIAEDANSFHSKGKSRGKSTVDKCTGQLPSDQDHEEANQSIPFLRKDYRKDSKDYDTDTTVDTPASSPSDAAILRALSERGTLKFREVYLHSIGLDPKVHQMGSGVRSVFTKRLQALAKTGLIIAEGSGYWKIKERR